MRLAMAGVAQAPAGQGRQVTLGLYAKQLDAAHAVLRHLGWQDLSRIRVRPPAAVKREARQYRHVTFHKGQWVARFAGARLGACRKQLDAAKLVARAAGLPGVQPLLLGGVAKRSGVQRPHSTASDFQGVSWHRPGPRSTGGWQAQVDLPNTGFCGFGCASAGEHVVLYCHVGLAAIGWRRSLRVDGAGVWGSSAPSARPLNRHPR